MKPLSPSVTNLNGAWNSTTLILTCLGDPDGEKATLVVGDLGTKFDGVLHVSQVAARFS